MKLFFEKKMSILAIYSAVLLLVALEFSCTTETILENGKYFVSGEVKYREAKSLDTLSDDQVKVSISYASNINDGLPRESTGSQFQFGPLERGDYTLSFTFEKDDITYTKADTTLVSLDSNFTFSNPIILTSPQADRFFIEGRALYPDPITGDTLTDETMTIKLVPTTVSQGTIESLTAIDSGQSYSFGPLPAGTYELDFELIKANIFEDGNTTVFSATTTVTILSTNIIIPDVVLSLKSGKTSFLTGGITYSDILSGQIGMDFSSLKLYITELGENRLPLSIAKSTDVNAPFLNHGPVSAGKYAISLVNTTNLDASDQAIIYSFQDTIDIEKSEVINKTYNLSWESNTALLLQVTDSLSIGTKAQVCLYQNEQLAIANLPWCQGTDSLSTDAQGRVLLQNLDLINYYFNVSTQIGSAVLNNHDSINETKSAILVPNILNNHSVKIYKK